MCCKLKIIYIYNNEDQSDHLKYFISLEYRFRVCVSAFMHIPVLCDNVPNS